MERSHIDEKEIQSIIQFPQKSKKKKKAFESFRNKTNFDVYISENVRPKRQSSEATLSDAILEGYLRCIYCKGNLKEVT